MPFLKFRKRSDASAAYALVAMRALALMLEPANEFTSSNVRMQRDVPMLLAPAIDHMLHAAYSQCGIQRVGIRHYPLPVDSYTGAELPEIFANQAAAFVADFGPHPLGRADPRTADVRTVISLAQSASLPPGATSAAEIAAAALRADDEIREEAVRDEGTVRLVAYKGGVRGGDDATVKLSYGRCFIERSRLEQWQFSLEPQLVWQGLTLGAPGRSLLSHETTLAHAQYVAALQSTVPEDGRPLDAWARLYM